jgi:hypothetical protein
MSSVTFDMDGYLFVFVDPPETEIVILNILQSPLSVAALVIDMNRPLNLTAWKSLPFTLESRIYAVQTDQNNKGTNLLKSYFSG